MKRKTHIWTKINGVIQLNSSDLIGIPEKCVGISKSNRNRKEKVKLNRSTNESISIKLNILLFITQT